MVIAVVGKKGAGKTATVEVLLRGLKEHSLRVASAKHISNEEFTIDVKGKDSWRHTQAGAHMVMLVAPKEMAIIKKGSTSNISVKEIVRFFEEDTDILILEGFKNLVERYFTEGVVDASKFVYAPINFTPTKSIQNMMQ